MAAAADVTPEKTKHAALSADDLISNAPLRANESGSVPDSDDRFQHRIVAQRVAQLIAAGDTSINIAVNGPWGSGKSTFFGLLTEELGKYKRVTWFKRTLRKRLPFLDPRIVDTKPRFTTVDFDAWQMADETFESNFLATVAPHVPHSPKNIEQRLFQANRSVNLPLGLEIPHPVMRRVLNVVLVLVLAFVVFGVPWFQVSAGAPDHFSWEYLWTKYVPALIAWTTAAAGGTLLVVVLGVVTKLWSVTVEESGPAHVTQFRKIFTEILKRSKTTQVILVDELDRCAPAATMSTLEGLRRFIGEDNCIFVVAFDRESVVATVDEEMLRTVPHRPGRPYYSTAGEYLDKIFTYQVALPPQPRKGFRKYARDLIADKQGGVWGELRTQHGQEALDRVISILSPPHLTSPRRTKVILNDFAINARMVHSFRNSWTERADEIAVLTVLQTEFPLFYGDLEHYPSLLAHVARRVDTDPGETIAPLVEQYTKKRAAYDTVFSSVIHTGLDTKDATTSDQHAVSPTNAVSLALGLQLERYLEKLRDMQVVLPMADLIQLGTGERMLEFEDPAVFAAVEAATEVPRHETRALLEKASPNDQHRAVEMMLNSIEGEPSAEAMNLRGLSGSLLPKLTEAQRQSLLLQINSSWDRILVADAVLHLEEAAILGYVNALASTKDQPWVDDVLRTTYQNPLLLAPGIHAMTERLRAATLHAARHELIDTAISVVRVDPKVLEALLTRLDEGQSFTLELQSAKKLAERLLAADIPGDDTRSVKNVGATARSLLRFRASTVGGTRTWLTLAFRLRAITDVEALPDYVEVLKTDVRREATRGGAVDEMLEALAAKAAPEFKSEVAKLLVSEGVSPSMARVLPALQALLRVVAKRAIDDESGVVEGISVLAGLLPKNKSISVTKTVGLVEAAYRDPAPMSPARLDSLLSVAHALSGVPNIAHTMQELTAALFINMTSDEYDQSIVRQGMTRMGKEPAEVLLRIVDDLRAKLHDGRRTGPAAVAMTLFAQQGLHHLGQPAKALSYAEISRQPVYVGTELLSSWIATAPSVEDINEALDGSEYSAVPDEVWEIYARRAPLEDRSRLWQRAVEVRKSPDTLRAIASQGIDPQIVADAAAAIPAAANVDARSVAVRIFLTLPRDAIAAAALVDPLITLLNQMSRADARAVFELLVHYTDVFNRSARARLQKAARRWFNEVRVGLSDDAAEQLLHDGWVHPNSKATKRLQG
ncbi:P-loop NTPase fold protein [Microbacterium sp.]|uniref:KAP family P-loop NTPase fold protein n=1 Tax=Microbacterium sp. TaxID=51671 RepID=UPI003569C205